MTGVQTCALPIYEHRQKEDLLHAAADLRDWVPGLRVEAWFATGVGGDASFARVE